MRYRYRIEPTPAQRKMLARVLGCCRVVFNDALRVRDEAYRAGVKLSDTLIQRQVITAAKTTLERGWLAEVPGVALVQSVNDSRRAWRDFFDSHTGKRNGRKLGRPRMTSRKNHRQSFRLTRTGFSVPVRWAVVCGEGGRGPGRLVARSALGAVERADHRGTGRPLRRQLRCRRRLHTAAAGAAGGRGGCGHHAVGDDRDQRRCAHRRCEPEVSGPQAAQVAAVGAGEVPPAEGIAQQGQDAAQSGDRAQRGGAGAAGLSPQAGFGVGSREPSDPRRGPQHRGHGQKPPARPSSLATRGSASSSGSSARKPTATVAPFIRCRGGWRRARRARRAGTGSTNSRYRYGGGRARRAGWSTIATTTPPRSFSPPGGRRD